MDDGRGVTNRLTGTVELNRRNCRGGRSFDGCKYIFQLLLTLKCMTLIGNNITVILVGNKRYISIYALVMIFVYNGTSFIYGI